MFELRFEVNIMFPGTGGEENRADEETRGVPRSQIAGVG